MNTVTVDTISLRGAGVLSVAQPSKGHRFTHDSVLLADFCRLRPRDRVLEPGSGTGVISLLLAKKYPRISVTAVEIDPESADLCRWNAQVNGLDDRMAVLNRDISLLRPVLKAGSFDAVVANPPYGRTGAGRRSPLPGRRHARHASARGLTAWLDLGRFLKNRGRFFLVFTADRAAEILSDLRSRGLEPKRLQWIHPMPGRTAGLVLIEAVKQGGTGISVLPPLFLQGPDGRDSGDMKEIYGLP